MLAAWIMAVVSTMAMSVLDVSDDIISPSKVLSATERHRRGAFAVFKPGAQAADMPKMPDDTELDVYYAQTDIKGAEAMQATHSGVTFKYEDKEGTPQVWTLDLYAAAGLFKSLCPSIDDSTGLPTWDNAIEVAFAKSGLNWDPNDEVAEVPLGKITGSVFNKLHDFIADYLNKHPIYQVWDVMPADKNPQIADSSRTIEAEVCDSFTEASIAELYRLDSSRLDKDPDMLTRNYQLLLTADAGTPEEVDPSSADVKRFWEDYSSQCNQASSFAELIPILAHMWMKSPVNFVHTSTTNYRVPLTGGPWGTFLDFEYAPMLTLGELRGNGNKSEQLAKQNELKKKSEGLDLDGMKMSELKKKAKELGLSKEDVKEILKDLGLKTNLRYKKAWRDALRAELEA